MALVRTIAKTTGRNQIEHALVRTAYFSATPTRCHAVTMGPVGVSVADGLRISVEVVPWMES
jgi:hypothetical protein